MRAVHDLERRADTVLAQVPVLLGTVAGQQLAKTSRVHVVVVIEMAKPPEREQARS